jgi:hypothetical protein
MEVDSMFTITINNVKTADMRISNIMSSINRIEAYTPENVYRKWLNEIQNIVGYPIKNVRKELKNNPESLAVAEEVLSSLEKLHDLHVPCFRVEALQLNKNKGYLIAEYDFNQFVEWVNLKAAELSEITHYDVETSINLFYCVLKLFFDKRYRLLPESKKYDFTYDLKSIYDNYMVRMIFISRIIACTIGEAV